MKLFVERIDRIYKVLLFIIACLLLGSCGSSGGDSTAQTLEQNEATDWDTLEWDRNNWS